MTENLYTQYENKYYNPNDDGKEPGDNENWESIQKGFSRITSTQLETSEGLTLGKGTEDETSVTAAELEELKNPTQLETSGGLTLGKGTEDETSVTAAELEELKNAEGTRTVFYSGEFGLVTLNVGFNVLQINVSNFPAGRLTGYRPGRVYELTGVVLSLTAGAIGIISYKAVTADSEGKIPLSNVSAVINATNAVTDDRLFGTIMISERG